MVLQKLPGCVYTHEHTHPHTNEHIGFHHEMEPDCGCVPMIIALPDVWITQSRAQEMIQSVSREKRVGDLRIT